MLPLVHAAARRSTGLLVAVWITLAPSAVAALTFQFETSFDVSTLGELESVDYDPASETLYLLDGLSDAVYIFTLVPEPASAAQRALGLSALALRRRAG